MLRDIACGVKTQLDNHIVNRESTTELALAALFAGGHILLDSTTGVGKSEWVQAFAGALGLTTNCWRLWDYSSLHEVTGRMTWNDNGENGSFTPGPLFSQVFFADFADAPHALLLNGLCDAIDSQIVHDYGSSYHLPEPFFMIANKTSILQMPDFFTDRFMLELDFTYPGVAAEKQLLQMHNNGRPNLQDIVPVCNMEAIQEAKAEVRAVNVDEAVYNHIISIVETTRRVGAVAVGASIRGSIHLLDASKAYAAIKGRDFAIVDDVRTMAQPVLRHRLQLKADAVNEGVQVDHIIESILMGRR